jgi:hypothetical protein
MGPHAECGFRLRCGLKRLLRYEGGERGTIVPHGLHTLADAIVRDGWHTTFAALVEFTGVFLPPSFYRDVKDTGCLFHCLQGVADAFPGMAITM